MLSEVKYSLDLWKKIVENSPDATFFHTPYWFELLKGVKGVTVYPPLILKYKTLYILFPYAKTRILKGFWSVYESIPIGIYGGPIADGEMDENAYEEMLRDIDTFFKGNLLITFPPGKELRLRRVFSETTTYIKELKEVEEKGMVKFSKGHKHAIRKAQKEIYVKEAGIQEVNTYERMYLSFVRETKRYNLYTPLFFEKLKILLKKGIVKLWIAVYREKVIAGALLGYFKDTVYYLHAARNLRYAHLPANHLICWCSILDAVRNHYRFYDFLPSGRHKSVEIFKKGFGTFPMSVKTYQGSSKILNIALKIQRIKGG